MQGWVAIYRKLMSSYLWSDPFLLKLWMYCLLKANHQSVEILIGLEKVSLNKGQFVTGRFSLADDFNRGAKKSDIVHERTLWRWLKVLERDNLLSIKSYSKYSIVSVVNWELYQTVGRKESTNYPTNSHEMTKLLPANTHEKSINNNENNKNNEKNENKGKNDNNLNVNVDVPDTPFRWSEKFIEFFNQEPNGSQIKDIQSLLEDGVEENLIIYAFEKASLRDKHYYYARAILKNLVDKGVKTLLKAEEENKSQVIRENIRNGNGNGQGNGFVGKSKHNIRLGSIRGGRLHETGYDIRTRENKNLI